MRNAPTPLMKELGYGKGYEYAHAHEGNVVAQQGIAFDNQVRQRADAGLDLRGALPVNPARLIQCRVSHSQKMPKPLWTFFPLRGMKARTARTLRKSYVNPVMASTHPCR